MKTSRVLLRHLALAIALSFPAAAQVQLELLWGLDPGSRPYLPTPGDDNQRGLAYNPITGNLLLVNRTGGLSVRVLDALTGADEGLLNTTGIAGGTFALNQVAVAGDGAIYAANLVTSSATSPFRVYRWADEGAVPALVYSGPLVAGRWGDNMDIRGAGNTTQILFGEGGTGVGDHLALLRTADNGATFTATTMTVTGLEAGETRGAVTFGAGDSFFTKDARGTTLRFGAFNLTTATAAVTASAGLPAGLSGFGPLDAAPALNLLAAIQLNTTANPQTVPHDLYLFDVSDPANPVALDHEPFVNPGVQNARAAGAVDFGNNNLVFALDANNGVRAYSVVPEPSACALLAAGVALLLWARRGGRAETGQG
jgi:hypothetical protein